LGLRLWSRMDSGRRPALAGRRSPTATAYEAPAPSLLGVGASFVVAHGTGAALLAGRRSPTASAHLASVGVAHNRWTNAQQDCPGCGTRGWVKQPPVVRLTDVPVFGRPAVAARHTLRRPALTVCVRGGSWTTSDARIAAPRGSVTHRDRRWLTTQVGEYRRAVSVVAAAFSKRLLTSGSVQPRHHMGATEGLTAPAAAPI
jgi:hypothetical protein